MTRPSHLHVLRVWGAATPEELATSRAWYDSARFAARVVAVVGRVPIEHAAGVLAALSPLNRWEDNVADAVAVARDAQAPVRSTAPNRWKAIRILAGEPPAKVLSGRKVIAFWRAILDPDHAGSIAIDRHLWRAVTGRYLEKQLAAPPNGVAYDLAEGAILKAAWVLGERPLVVASALWLVMRRGDRHQGRIEW